MVFLVDKDVRGAINGSSEGTISIREIIEYIEKKTGAERKRGKEIWNI